MPAARERGGWGAALLLVITVIAYITALRGGYIWDDDFYVTHNIALRSLDGLWRIWTDPWATPQYYPLVHTTFWIEYHLWGVESALGFHLVNVLLHALSAVLLWRLLRRLEVPLAWLAAAIFAVHPVEVESVAWITERKNVLSGVFYLLAFGTYLKAIGAISADGKWQTDDKAADPFSFRHYAVAFLFFVFALFSKTVTATFPAAVLLVLWWKRGRLRWRDVRPLIPFFLVALVMSSVTGYLERTHVGAHGPEWSVLTPIDRVLIAGRAIWFYAGKVVAPIHLTFIYPRWTINSHAGWQYLFPAGAAAVVIVLWMLRKRLGRGPLTAVLFFIGTLVPALGFVNVYPMRYSFVADHFQYLASIGLIVLFTAILAKAARKPMIVRPIAAVVLITLMIATALQGRIYRDSETLWRDTIRKNPTSWMAHTNLGKALYAQGRDDETLKEYRAALQLAPNLPDTHQALGCQLAEQGQLPQAIAQFQQAIQLDRNYVPAYAYLAQAMLMENKPSQAEQIARRAIEVEPHYAMGHAILAQALEQSGRFAEAATEYTAALGNDPNDATSHFHLADCLQRLGRPRLAFDQYQAAVALDPKNAAAWTDLGMMLLHAGQSHHAAECFEKALEADPHLIPAQQGLWRARQSP